ncbi:hypothetical protein ElyMa_000442400 [Elysia marginata]|uniref:Uncharacterized protein n=1 Tax=Elysia marginata TaxID=1093978 RepID=A0AAV4FN80_9GAST|nr:hypothetical protein ElyMa_000442400 [Elysia marginata]
MAAQNQTQGDPAECHNECKTTDAQMLTQKENLMDPIPSQDDHEMTGLESKQMQEIEHSRCEMDLSSSEIKTVCNENKVTGREVDDLESIHRDATEEIFYEKQKDVEASKETVGSVSSVSSLSPTTLSETTTETSNQCVADTNSGCTSNAENSNSNSSNNNNDNNNKNNNNKIDDIDNGNTNNTSTDNPYGVNLRKSRPLHKILSPLFSSSSTSAPSFFPSSMHRTASSLSSISEEEMLSMMESMGESEILSALPPCDCDECLLNGSNSSTPVPPDQRKLTRVSKAFGCGVGSRRCIKWQCRRKRYRQTCIIGVVVVLLLLSLLLLLVVVVVVVLLL